MNEENIIKLPSKGLCYPVSSPLRSGVINLLPFTVKDENNLFSLFNNKNNKELYNIVFKNKIKEDINFNELCTGDKEAIFLHLRISNYGKMFKKQYNNKEYDLTKIKYKKFNLISNEEGMFKYITDTNEKIYFKYMTFLEENEILDNFLKEINNHENINVKEVYNSLTKKILKKMIKFINDEKNNDYVEKWINKTSEGVLKKIQRYIFYNSPGLDEDTTNGISFNETLFYDIK